MERYGESLTSSRPRRLRQRVRRSAHGSCGDVSVVMTVAIELSCVRGKVRGGRAGRTARPPREAEPGRRWGSRRPGSASRGGRAVRPARPPRTFPLTQESSMATVITTDTSPQDPWADRRTRWRNLRGRLDVKLSPYLYISPFY